MSLKGDVAIQAPLKRVWLSLLTLISSVHVRQGIQNETDFIQ